MIDSANKVKEIIYRLTSAMHGVFAASSSPSTVLVVPPSLVPSAVSAFLYIHFFYYSDE